jgi:hypothetical protein
LSIGQLQHCHVIKQLSITMMLWSITILSIGQLQHCHVIKQSSN